MAKAEIEPTVRLDLNNPVVQENLLTLQKPERLAAPDTLGRLRQMTWNPVYRDGNFIRLLNVAPNHDSTYGRK